MKKGICFQTRIYCIYHGCQQLWHFSCWRFIIFQQDEFHAHMSMKKLFFTSGPDTRRIEINQFGPYGCHIGFCNVAI